MSEYIAKASIEPRDYRVVFLIQKVKCLYRHIYFIIRPGAKQFQILYRFHIPMV